VKARTFVDTVTIQAWGGNGGNGCTSFRREKYVPYGGPDGGDGGHGGHVILKGSRHEDSLIGLFFNPHVRAEDGGHGKGAQRTGRNGASVVVPVPLGTQVFPAGGDTPTGDVIEDGQELTVARGGKGGLGNVHWKSSTNRAPMRHTDGERGEQLTLQLTLKLIADAGFVGYPNAGKSSLLRALTDAHPKVAAYPFTTLHPAVGALEVDPFRRMRIVDVPGIIAGAHDGVGLGFDFLRHIERVPFMIFVVDMAGSEGRDPVADYRSVREEMKAYRADLLQRPSLVVANKMDLPEAETNLKTFRRKTRTKPIPVSSLTGDGVSELRAALIAVWTPAHPVA
jgi:GTP-binding protein